MEDGKSFHKLATDCTHEWIRDIYKIIDGKAPRYVADAEAKPISHSTDEISQIRRFMYDEVKRRRSKEGVKYQSLTECKEEMFKRSMQTMRCIMDMSPTKDGEKLSIGFNDEKGRFHDNRIGKGRRHEHDPLWVRVEVVRIVVD